MERASSLSLLRVAAFAGGLLVAALSSTVVQPPAQPQPRPALRVATSMPSSASRPPITLDAPRRENPAGSGE